MRRSSAPSQNNDFKRQKLNGNSQEDLPEIFDSFNPRTTHVINPPQTITPNNSHHPPNNIPAPRYAPTFNKFRSPLCTQNNVNKLSSHNNVSSSQTCSHVNSLTPTQVNDMTKFSSPPSYHKSHVNHTNKPSTNHTHVNNVTSFPNQTVGVTQKGDAVKKHGYFSVMWCKASKKKHKKWEGDAVLVTTGRTAVLYDMDNKEIGKSSGYKVADLEKLAEDETLMIGAKEIQVMSVISEESYKTGACFLDNTVTAAEDTENITQVPKALSKPFVKPQKYGTSKMEVVNDPNLAPRLLYNPDRPGALVMPRPSQVHQWENSSGQSVVDVVVDPYISQHLRVHQKEGITFLYECILRMREYNGAGAILADDMGLGKTIQTIAVIWTLLKQGPYGGKPMLKRVLIVTPGSLVKNWKQEFKKWLGDERLSVFAVGQDNTVKDFTKTNIYPVLIISYEMFMRNQISFQQTVLWNANRFVKFFDDKDFTKTNIYPVLIISYEMFMRNQELLKKLRFDLVVCDEGHRLKNSQIKTTTALMSLDCKKRIVLTGTPIQNDLHEFFSIIDFVNPAILGTSSTFRKVFSEPIVASRQPNASQEEQELGESRAAELNRLTKLFILRRTQDVNNKYLPPKRDLVVFCRPSTLQLRLYDQLLRHPVIRGCLHGSIDGPVHLVCISALKKLCNHPGLVYQSAVDAAERRAQCDDGESSIYQDLLPVFPANIRQSLNNIDMSGKMMVLCDLLASLYSLQPPEHVALVSNHTKTLDILQHMCQSQGYTFLRLDGQTPTSKRQDIVQQFNNKYSQVFIFLLSSKAGGVGLNLIGASRLILYDIDWNPANDLQAMARVWRDGQRQLVHVYRFITTGSIEEKIYQRQISKQGLSGAVIDVKSKSDLCFSREDLKDLFTMNTETDCETHDLLKCQCWVTGVIDVGQVTDGEEMRPCQLGAHPVPKKKRNATMDELLDWKHAGCLSQLPQDCWLSSDEISYVFWNETHRKTDS